MLLRKRKNSHREQFKQKFKNIKMFSTFCFSSDFTSNIYKLETEEILNRFVCEIFKMEFEINSTKKPVNIPVQCLIKKRCIQD